MSDRSNDQGWALISVLWVVAILSMLAMAVQSLGVTSYRLDKRAEAIVQDDALFDSILTIAFLGISDSRTQQRFRVDGTPKIIHFDGKQIELSVQDQLALIDLNATDGSLIRQILRSSKLPPPEVEKLADKILDWRDSDSAKRTFGAEAKDYTAKGYAYRPRNGPFQSVEELRLVMDMPPALYEKLAKVVTVYSGRPAIDDNLASEEVLRAYYSGSSSQLEEALRRRGLNSAMQGKAGGLDTVMGRAYRVNARLMDGKRNIERHGVILITNNADRPYEVMAWQ